GCSSQLKLNNGDTMFRSFVSAQSPGRLKRAALIACAAVVTLAAPVCGSAEEVTLRAVSSFNEKTFFSRHFESFVDKVNAEGKGLVQIRYIGGPQNVPAFEVGNAVRAGVVDMA